MMRLPAGLLPPCLLLFMACNGPERRLYELSVAPEISGRALESAGTVELWGAWLEEGESPAVVGRLARVRSVATDLELSLGLVDIALVDLPGQPALHAARGGLLVEMGFLRAAELEYQCAVELDPARSRSWWCLGLVRHRLGLHHGAEQALTQAFELGMRDPELLQLQGELRLAVTR